MKTVFFRLLEAEDKGAALRAALSDPTVESTVYRKAPQSFQAVPKSPFSYWVADTVLSLFAARSAFQANGRVAASGGKTLDDFRWIRAAWEAGYGPRHRWVGYAKGGAFSRHYSDVYLLLDWRNDAQSLKTYLVDYRASRGWSPNWTAELHGSEHYFRPGLTWPRRTQGGLSLRALPRGCIFGDKGPAAFVEGDSPADLLALLAIANTKAFGALVELQMAFGSYEVGVIQRTPVPDLALADRDSLARLARRAWSLKRSLDTTNETSHAFFLPPGPNEAVTGLDPAAIERELAEIQREIDDRVFDLYGFGPEDRASIEGPTQSTETDADDDEEDAADSLPGAPADTLLSWFVGVAFGRFDLRLATGERPIPPEPEPFDPLPARSPGMLPEGDEPEWVPPSILVDDAGHDQDIRSHVAANMAKTGWPDPDDLRPWLAKQFFELHIKMYSKSRRKAPIYWQLATPSASYSVWLYYHRFTRDTFYQVLHDYVAPKVLHEERNLTEMMQASGGKPTASQRKELDRQEAFVEELRALRDEVARVAPLWNPNLDDGVILNFAPLWRLVPQHKAWQRECKACWDKLAAGEYDWAHLAMHLWPERVVPKCAEDRSLAIAHGLEAVFWEEGEKGKWHARAVSKETVVALVAERTSAAVKEAVRALEESSPLAVGGGRKGGKRGKKKAGE